MTQVAPRPRRRHPTPPSAPGASQPQRVEAPTPVASEHPPMHELWQTAGGGTDAYDADRYVGLLREHGYIQQRRGLIAICAAVLERWRAKGAMTIVMKGEDLAPLLVDELGLDGYRIHDITRCVRPPGPDPVTVGRPMTPEEEAALLPSAGAIPADHFEHITPEGDRFLVPNGYVPGEKSSRCRSCDALILWCETRNKKRSPTNPDGTSHFSSCPQAPAWRKKADGE